jgi:hypothetical protein
MLCAICVRVFSTVGIELLHNSVDHLQQAAAIGCYICIIVYNQFQRFVYTKSGQVRFHLPFLKADISTTVSWRGAKQVKIDVHPVHKEAVKLWVRSNLYSFAYIPELAPRLEVPVQASGLGIHASYRKIPPTTGDPEAGVCHLATRMPRFVSRL